MESRPFTLLKIQYVSNISLWDIIIEQLSKQYTIKWKGSFHGGVR